MLCASPGAKIVIGDDCLVSYAVHLRTDMHRHSDPDVPVNRQGHDEADIVLGDNVWVGYGAQVMSGVTVGSNSIVGAGAVITRERTRGRGRRGRACEGDQEAIEVPSSMKPYQRQSSSAGAPGDVMFGSA